MKIRSISITLTLLCLTITVLAQDTTAYELQRNKINALLAERSAKFGQYDESLSTRTGIFGFQTKRDIKNSNEILRQIVINDNNIFTELKVLLDYKDIQFQQAKTDVNNNQVRIDSYKKTIRDLQVKNEELLNFNKKVEQSLDYTKLLIGLLVLTVAALIYFLKRKNDIINTSKNTSIKVL
jgi:hypothetical protein